MLRRIALFVVSTLLALVAAEVLLRLLHAAPDVGVIHRGRFRLSANPKIGFEPVPGFTYHGSERSFIDFEGSGNALGYRDVDHAEEKPPGVYRIVVIGDSVGAGLKVERYDDTFPPLLARRLSSSGVRAEVINLSVSGYNTQQEVETLRDRGLRYAPDLVLVAYSLNDRERLDGGIMDTLLAQRHEEPRVNPYLMGSALYRFLVFRVLGGGRHAAAPGKLTPPPRQDAPTDAESRRALAQVSGDTVDEYLGELRQLSQAHRFEVLLSIFPYYPRTFRDYKRRDQHRFASGEGQKYGFHVLDLLEVMAACRQSHEEPINADNFHPSAVGHRCAADAMTAVIRGEILHR
jgi:lysophospholipase L1-like esterase